MRIDWSALASRVADRADLDWLALERSTASGAERRALRALSEAVRRAPESNASRTMAERPTAIRWLAGCLGLFALFQAAGALAWSALIESGAGEIASPFAPWQRATMVVCGIGGMVLRLCAGPNEAVRALGAMYLGVSAAFVGSVIGQPTPAAGQSQRAALELLSWPADLALPAGIWAFVACFPPLEAGARLQRLTLRAAAVASLVICCVFAANVALPHIDARSQALERLLAGVSRKDLRSHYTPVFFAVAASAVPFGLARLGFGYVRAKREVRRLFLALAAGLAPVAVLSTVGASSQAGAAFLTQPAVLPTATLAVFAGLWSLPLSTGAALLDGRTLHVQSLFRASLRYATSVWALTVAIVGPLAVCAYLALSDRAATIDAFLSAGGSTWLLMSAASVVLATFRSQARQAIDRAFSRRTPDVRNLISTLAAAARRQPSAQGVADLLIDAITRACAARVTAVVVREPLSETLLPIAGDSPGIPMDSATAALLASSSGAVQLRGRSAPGIATLLPEAELSLVSRWSVLVPLHGEGDELVGVACVGEPSAAGGYSTADIDTLLALCASVGHVLGHRLGVGSDDAPAARAAQECDRCGALAHALGTACGCGGALVGASLPRQLGRFRVLRRVGSGGMGVVYAALDETLNRVIALKALPEVSLEERTRLQQEARMMATLQHQGIASVFGLEMYRAMPVLVIEYFASGTLQDRLRDRSFSAHELAALTVQLASALDHVHAAGLLHRDLKPSNIGFTAASQPKLFDFGIAARAGVDEVTTAGTLLYLAPEAARGERVSAASDVWSLAVVFCEAWMGRHPAADLPYREQVALIRSGKLWARASGACPRDPVHFHTALAYALNPDASLRCSRASDFARMIATTDAHSA